MAVMASAHRTGIVPAVITLALLLRVKLWSLWRTQFQPQPPTILSSNSTKPLPLFLFAFRAVHCPLPSMLDNPHFLFLFQLLLQVISLPQQHWRGCDRWGASGGKVSECWPRLFMLARAFLSFFLYLNHNMSNHCYYPPPFRLITGMGKQGGGRREQKWQRGATGMAVFKPSWLHNYFLRLILIIDTAYIHPTSAIPRKLSFPSLWIRGLTFLNAVAVGDTANWQTAWGTSVFDWNFIISYYIN